MSKKIYTGINIQWPISELILSGKKTIETRTYPCPRHLLNEEILIIETPGKRGKFKARIVGIVKFTECFLYEDKKSFYRDIQRHQVDPKSEWAWTNKPKWGWEIKLIKKFAIPLPCTKRGITFRKGLEI